VSGRLIVEETLHATTVAINGHAVMIEGPSGAGKSDLALRLIDRGAVLVSDDRTIVKVERGALRATAPDTIAGRIEVRGLGILPMPHADGSTVALIVRLTDQIERLPLTQVERCIAGIAIPEVMINPHEASAPIKVELALKWQLG
jgi:serine kinase of HPr protein (carbohydrate metabolism regulator)